MVDFVDIKDFIVDSIYDMFISNPLYFSGKSLLGHTISATVLYAAGNFGADILESQANGVLSDTVDAMTPIVS
jgi:hypothetical protein